MRFSYLFYEPISDLARLERRMARLAELGYGGIELSAAHPLGMSAEQIAALAAKHGLAVVSFLSGWSYSNEGLCLSSPDAAVRDRAVDRLSEYVQLAGSLHALVVVGLMQGLRGDEPDVAIANDRIAECLRRVAKIAETAGTSVVIEPVNHLQVGFNHTVAEAAAMADRVKDAVRSQRELRPTMPQLLGLPGVEVAQLDELLAEDVVRQIVERANPRSQRVDHRMPGAVNLLLRQQSAGETGFLKNGVMRVGQGII